MPPGGTPLPAKCCCCVPLRTGLIVLGYVDLVVSLGALPLLASLAAERARRGAALGAALPVAAALTALHAALSTLLLVAAHKRRGVLLAIYAGLALVFHGTALVLLLLLLRTPSPRMELEDMLYIVFFGVNLYLVLLVWSESRRLLSAPPRPLP